MLLSSVDLLFQDPVLFLAVVMKFLATGGVALIVSISVHEFSHAAVALALGEPTARCLGRFTLNPIRHLDKVGTAMLLLVGFGWGKPVPINPSMLGSDPRRKMAMIAGAGPISNILTACVVGLPVRLNMLDWQSPFWGWNLGGINPSHLMLDTLGFLIFFNIILAVFNLLPIFPLDGSKIVGGFLSSSANDKLARWEAIGPAVLLVIIMFDWFTSLNLLWGVLRPAVDVLGFIAIGRPL